MKNSQVGIEMIEFGILEASVDMNLISLKFLSVVVLHLLKNHHKISKNSVKFLYGKVVKTAFSESKNLEFGIFGRHLLANVIRSGSQHL